MKRTGYCESLHPSLLALKCPFSKFIEVVKHLSQVQHKKDTEKHEQTRKEEYFCLCQKSGFSSPDFNFLASLFCKGGVKTVTLPCLRAKPKYGLLDEKMTLQNNAKYLEAELKKCKNVKGMTPILFINKFDLRFYLLN